VSLSNRGDSAGWELPPVMPIDRGRGAWGHPPSDQAGARRHGDGRDPARVALSAKTSSYSSGRGSALGPAGDRFITVEANLTARTLDLQHI
jgi:hypothetical protein